MFTFLLDRFYTRLAVLPQYLLPKLALTKFAGWVANAERGVKTTRLINWFIKKYQVNMAEAANPDPASYASFNAFFTRALRADARPLANARWVCPVDGAISQFGKIDANQIFQAKGHRYNTETLLGGDTSLAKEFQDGHFACIYLSPKDYHRIHMPCDATLRSMKYVPGDLFSVNPTTARGVPNLFARNERLVCVFDTPHGAFVNVLVGATIVGSMATTWAGVIKRDTALVHNFTYDKDSTPFKQGDEMARFLLGSTVVMLWPKEIKNCEDRDFTFNEDWAAGKAVRLGEEMAG